MFYTKDVLRNFAQFTGKYLCQSLFFKQICSLRVATLLKEILWHRCFPLNCAKFLRTTFFIEHVRWLLLKRQQQNSFYFKENTEQPPVLFPEMISSDTFHKDETFFYCFEAFRKLLEIATMELICVKVGGRSL